MNSLFFGVKCRTAVIICCAALLGGCSYTAMPKNVPMIKEPDASTLTGVSVIVTNAETDATESDVLTDRGESSGFLANRQAWSRKLVEALARELARRGAHVRGDAPLRLSVALPEIIFIETREQIQFKVKVAVSSSTGWTKNYEGVAGSERRRIGSVSEAADRLAGLALAEAIRAMLVDGEFVSQLAPKQNGR
jgi:hypothetical protein